MSELQAGQVCQLLEQQVYYQGCTLYALVFALGVAIAIGVCYLLYRAIKIFY